MIPANFKSFKSRYKDKQIDFEYINMNYDMNFDILIFDFVHYMQYFGEVIDNNVETKTIYQDVQYKQNQLTYSHSKTVYSKNKV